VILAFDWSSGYGIAIAVAGGVLTIGGAVVFLLGYGGRFVRWLRPPEPLVSLGHPTEDATPWVWAIDGSDAEWERQQRAYEDARLSSLTISYIVENKDDTAIRDVTTGICTRDGRKHRFEEWFVQILAAHETEPVANVRVPDELHAGMTDTDRAENFVFWTRFRDEDGRRWEALYDPKRRDLSYTRLRQRDPR